MTIPQPIIEGLKEAGRVVVLAVVSWLLTEGVLDSIFFAFHIAIDPSEKPIVIALITTVLKAIDKSLHEQGKQNTLETGMPSALTSGLTRF